MTMIQYLNAFRLYKPCVLLLALGVTLITALLKKTLLKNCSKQLYLFVPFLVGTLVFAVFEMIVKKSFSPLTEDLCATVEGGFACGCAATLYYLAYEQFIRKRKRSVTSLLVGVIPDEKMEEVADKLTKSGKALQGDTLYAFVLDTLRKNADSSANDDAIKACAFIVTELLTVLNTSEK